MLFVGSSAAEAGGGDDAGVDGAVTDWDAGSDFTTVGLDDPF